MLFNSLKFAIFLPIIFMLYYIAPKKYRWGVILVANIVFYLGFGFKNFVIITLVTLISYVTGLFLRGDGSGNRGTSDSKAIVVAISVFVMVGILFVYKYTDFVISTINSVAQSFDSSFKLDTLRLIAPVGISFYTFKAISYVVDVSKKKMAPVTNFGKYAAYVAFFPQVASGPIERPESFFESIEADNKFEYEKATYALKLMALGFFKKMIVADKLAGYVNKVYADTTAYSGFALMAVIFFFTVQIYCDFSGYSDIANGVARLLGLNGADNFKSPYFASSVKEFWARWHISLSTWFRDYIYIPLGGNRKGKLRYAINIMITFLVSGLWHGAAWTFVIWGGMHGLMQVLETFGHNMVCKLRGIDPKDKSYTKKGVYKWISILFVFVFVNIAWVFFKASSMKDAIYVIGHSFSGFTSPVSFIKGGFNSLGINSKMFIHLALVILMVAAIDLINLKNDVIKLVGRLPKVVRWIIYILFIDLMFIWFLQYGADSASFVYFDF